jgi:hypothetical protein
MVPALVAANPLSSTFAGLRHGQAIQYLPLATRTAGFQKVQFYFLRKPGMRGNEKAVFDGSDL